MGLSCAIRSMRYHQTILDKKCIHCGKEFKEKRTGKGICSVECKKKRRSIFRPQTFKECLYCGEVFGPLGRLSTKFCSHLCKALYLKKENHPAWKGGLARETACARASEQYKKWRDAVFNRDNFTCRICGDRSRAGHRIEINAHHIQKLSEFKDLRYVLSNGITVCTDCHRDIHFPKRNTGKKAVKL